MTKLLVFFLSVTVNCCIESKVDFKNAALQKEVNSFLKELKKSKSETFSVIFESTKMGDSVFISMSNGYPNIQLINSYAKYKGVYFCFKEDSSAKDYYEIVNPESMPSHIKKAYEERRQEGISVFYEPLTKYLTFYKGKLVESVFMNED